jgi:hypothetical protein
MSTRHVGTGPSQSLMKEFLRRKRTKNSYLSRPARSYHQRLTDVFDTQGSGSMCVRRRGFSDVSPLFSCCRRKKHRQKINIPFFLHQKYRRVDYFRTSRSSIGLLLLLAVVYYIQVLRHHPLPPFPYIYSPGNSSTITTIVMFSSSSRSALTRVMARRHAAMPQRRTALPAVGAVRHLNVHEYVSMELFQKFGIRTPQFKVCNTPEEAETAYHATMNKRKLSYFWFCQYGIF